MSDSLKVFDKVLAYVQEIKDKGNFIPDCTTKDGYEASKNFVLKVTTPARTALTNAHKDAKAFYLDGGRMVDAKKNELMDMLMEIQEPHQLAYKAVDDEVKRVKAEKEAAIQNGFDTLNGYIQSALNQTSDFIDGLIGDCGSFDADEAVFGKQLPEVIALQQKVMSQLTDAYSQALMFEDMQKKQAEAQAIIDKQNAEREANEKAVAEANQREQMRIEAEQAAAEENERLKREYAESESRRLQQEAQAKIDAESARLKAEMDAKAAAEDAAALERKKQADALAKEKADAEAREADKAHRGSINSQAMDCLIAGGLTEDQAKLAVKLIAAKKIAHVQIKY